MSETEKPKLRSERLIELIEKASAILDERDVKLIAEAAQTARRLESGEGFNCESVVSMRDGRALLDCSWMGMLAQISPDQARSIALGLLETAAEAESDAAMMQFFQETGLPPDRAAAAVYSVRQLRRARSPVVGEKQEPPQIHNVVPFGSKPS